MHYKKCKLHKLHSIPIGLCKKACSLIRFSSGRVPRTRRHGSRPLILGRDLRKPSEKVLKEHSNFSTKRLYLVSYSIPLSCMVVLLLGLGVMVNPELFLVDKSSAITIQDEWVVKKNSSSSGYSAGVEDENDSGSNAVENADSIDDSFGGFGGDKVELSQEDTDAGISLQSIVPAPTLAITVSNSNQTIDAVQGGNTVYGSYNVGITGSNVKDYTLSIKADAVNLVSPSQASTPTTVTGAGGKTGDSMTANTWGYKLTETSTAESSYGTLNYASLPTTLTQIANGTVASPYNLSANKKLVFAAKFSDTAAPGTYKGHITLSAVANQAVVGAIWSSGVDSGITDMQDVSSGFCRNNSKIATGDTIELKDNRDDTTYTIVKLGDKCWMGQNLSLTGPKTLASGDSDFPSGMTWDLPASVGSGGTNTNNVNTSNTWDTSNYNVIQIRTGSTNLSTSWKSGYGNYYSWPAATAGTGTTSVTSADASASICPKGWKLPPNSGADSYTTLTGTKSSWTTATFNGNSGVYGYYLGSTATNIYKGANFWPAAGGVYQTSGALGDAGSYGYYWSRTAYSNSSYAYRLLFSSSGVYPTSDASRFYGYSVRCVATY